MKIGDCLAVIYDSPQVQDYPDDQESEGATAEKSLSSSASAAKTQFSKKAKELIKQHGLSEERFYDKRFVRERDVLEYLNAEQSVAKDERTDEGQTRASFLKQLPIETSQVKLPFRKVTEIRNLLNNQNLITSNFASRIRLPETFIQKDSSTPFKGLKSTLVPFILKQTCKLLKEFKEFNAFFDSNNIHYYKEVNLGYLLDLDKGLVVVNLGDLEAKSLREINNAIMAHVKRHVTGKIPVKDLFGSTFSVTDVSSEDVLTFSPLINKFQSAVLGISSIDTSNSSLILNLVFDHRVTEGKRATRFLKRLKELVESGIVQDND